MIVNYLVAMYELVSTILARSAFVSFWDALQDYDEKVRLLGYPRNESSTEIGVWILLVSQGVIWILVNQSGMYAFMETWMFNVNYMLLYIGSAVSVFKFFGLAMFVGQRFSQLNRMAKENLPARVGYKSTTLSKKVRRCSTRLANFRFSVLVAIAEIDHCSVVVAA